MGREVSPFSLAEYVQMACMGRHTLLIEVETERACGVVAVRDGEPWSADYGGQSGERAFFAMVNAGECAIQVRRWSGPAGPRELCHGCQELLMRAAVQRDEARHLGELVGEGLRAVITGDYARAFGLLERASMANPEDVRVRHQLKRLEALGYTGSVGAPIIAIGETRSGGDDPAAGGAPGGGVALVRPRKSVRT